MAGTTGREGPVPSDEGDSAKPTTSITAFYPMFTYTFLHTRFMNWLRPIGEVHPSSTATEENDSTVIDIAINPDTRLQLTQEQRIDLYNVLPRRFQELVESTSITGATELVGRVLDNRYRVLELFLYRKTGQCMFYVEDVSDKVRYFLKAERFDLAKSVEQEHEISAQGGIRDWIHQLGATLTSAPQLQYASSIRDWEPEGGSCVIMEPFGPSLDLLWKHCDHRFTMKTCLYITTELLEGYRYLHQAGFIHNAMNLDGYHIGGRENNKGHVYIVDFDNVRMYDRDPRSRPRQVDARWSSIWADGHLAEEPRSEIMSLALMMIFLLGGDNQPPWMSPGLGWINQDFEEHQYHQAKASWVSKVANGHRTKEFAPFENMIAYCVNDVKQGQCGDYNKLIAGLQTYAKHHRFELDDTLEWEEHLWRHPMSGRIAIRTFSDEEWAWWV
jgi:hypothetical protein